MPFINSKVSIKMTEEQKEVVKRRLGEAIECIPGKSEMWLMVELEEECTLYFKGEAMDKLAFVEIKIFGTASNDAYDKLTKVICSIYEEELSIPKSQTYVRYEEGHHWGWNGANF